MKKLITHYIRRWTRRNRPLKIMEYMDLTKKQLR